MFSPVCITKITKQDEIFNLIKNYSENSVSFHEFISDINNDFTKEDNKPEQNELFQTYNKKIKNCYAQIDEENKKTQENNGEHLRFSVQFI